jgi:DNA (cytosine-5)-methyltransferase 1
LNELSNFCSANRFSLLPILYLASYQKRVKPDHLPMIPIIDIFAGPGGLGEGFSAFRDDRYDSVFKIKLSIEKDPYSHQTLKLRSFVRQFEPGNAPDLYYDILREGRSELELYDAYPIQANAADKESWLVTLGAVPNRNVRAKIKNALGGIDDWVLIGGPPCQAYSSIGRSRNKGVLGYDFEKDERSTLYEEYLQIIADFWPSVFVMENVKGIISARFSDKKVFERISEDLADPVRAIGARGRSRRKSGEKHKYRLYAISPQSEPSFALDGLFDLNDFIVLSEEHGVPQTRHRVFIVGVREDIAVVPKKLDRNPRQVSVSSVISDLPRLRSGLSRREDNPEEWRSVVRQHFSGLLKIVDEEIAEVLLASYEKFERQRLPMGGLFVKSSRRPKKYRDWYEDKRIGGAFNHEARTHMESDLERYLFCSAYTEAHGISPKLRNFPKRLLPNHKSAKSGNERMFADRFRTQHRKKPATTITSHLAKDGHYYIHHDSSQCRSFTVREAARIQTFPDNYYFCGTRGSQYRQVGNAVPPLLARQIAKIVYGVFE